MIIQFRLSIILVVIAVMFTCGACGDNSKHTQKEWDSLQAEIRQLRELYRPGLGDIMSRIQLHHAKLWFAGKEGNWALAQFELNEIKENLEDAGKFYPAIEKVEIPMAQLVSTLIDPSVNALSGSVKNKDLKDFVLHFNELTAGCNACHNAAQHGFIYIIRPVSQPVSNQKFSQ